MRIRSMRPLIAAALKSSPSASIFTSIRPGSALTATAAAGAISIVARVGGPALSMLAVTRGNRTSPRMTQAGRAPELDALVVDGCQRARDELDRDEPASSGPDHRRGQGDHASLDRDDRAIGGGDDRATAIRHGDAAGQRVFLDAHLKQVGQIVERHDFAAVLHGRGNRPASRRARRASGDVAGAESWPDVVVTSARIRAATKEVRPHSFT